MSTWKGRQLGFLLLLCSGWAVARFGVHSWPQSAAANIATAPDAGRSDAPPQRTAFSAASPIHPASGIFKSVVIIAYLSPNAPILVGRNTPFPRQPERIALTSLPQSPSQTQAFPRPESWVESSSTQSVPVVAPAAAHPPRNPIAEIYAYSYWRWNTQSNGLAAAGQYGGSQSGLIAAFPLRGLRLFEDSDNLALLFRAVITPDSWADREVAMGLRWRPIRVLPITLAAERRFRPVGPDRTAVYLAGGVDGFDLPAQFSLDSYAQGGFVSGRGAGPFFDASARAYRPVYKANVLSARIGGGIWAAGQRGASRLDAGPSIETDISLGNARLRISGDWRFRIAGDAQPGNGPAFTLSTSF